MLNRAYSMLDVKAFDDDARKFSGVATTPTVDRVGDIIEPLGVKFSNPMPLLHQHKHDAPVGHVRFKKPTKDGVEFEAEIVKVDEPGPLKDRVDTAWLEIRHGLVRATSIGFRPVEYSFMDNGGIRYSEVEVYELSTVTIPANAEALIAVKSIDAEARHAAGVPDPEIPVRSITGGPRRDRKTAVEMAIITQGEVVFGPDALCFGIDLSSLQIPAQPEEPAAPGRKVLPVVRLDEPAGVSAKPFVINQIKVLSR